MPPAVSTNRSTTAVGVLGQRGQLASATLNDGGLDGGALFSPTAVAVDASGNLWVSDTSNNRVLKFLQPYPISARILLGLGWNQVALPSGTSLTYSASLIVNQIKQEGGNATEVAVYQ